MSAESYKKVIDLTQSDLDWKAIALDLAKNHPAAFVKSANRVDRFLKRNLADERRQLDEECLRIWHEEGNKVGAIKHCRNQTGTSLKEAKEHIESL